MRLGVGHSQALAATALPTTASDRRVVWSTSDAELAAVTGGGRGTARALGAAVVTATTVDGGFTAGCSVTVGELSDIAAAASTFSAGDTYSLAIKADGTLWAWGDNSYGSLGLGDYIDRGVPTQVGTENNWASVSAGYLHTLAIKTDGSLWGWGYCADGELGIGPNYGNYDRNSPVRIGNENNWASVAASSYYSMAIKKDGSLWGWGLNSCGQVGVAPNPTGFIEEWVPVRAGLENDWAFVAVGREHTMIIKKDGSLWAMGTGGWGQLGLGHDYEDWKDRHIPSRVGDNTYVAVSAGYAFTMALDTDGRLWGWGDNYNYQLGNPSYYESWTPILVNEDDDWVFVGTGEAHTLALKANGSLWGWGWDGFQQLGFISDDYYWEEHSPVQSGTDTDWAFVSAGREHTLATKDDGSLWAWGRNNYSQVGNGVATDPGSYLSEAPFRVGSGFRSPTN
jgi:alpha-tubulin suppressor-like RCC1 family protein